jgi:YVTN family beta-propeller protein
VTGFADQSNNTSTPTPTASLIVNKHVRCNFTSGCPAAGQFSITASTNNGSSISFRGSETGTSLSLTPPFPITYKVTENNPPFGVVIATIRVGPVQVGIAFNPNNGYMYVANTISNTVSVIDSSTSTVIATIRVGAAPIDIALNQNIGNMYVANVGGGSGGDTVSVIDSSTNTVIATIPVGSFAIAFNANNGNMYVTNFGATGPGDTVSVIAPLTTIYSSGSNGTIDGGQAATCNLVNTFGK